MIADVDWVRIFGNTAVRGSAVIGLVGTTVAPLVLRIALALPFFRSGLTRWDSFLSLSIGTQFLFEEQFKLHLFGNLYGFPFPDIVAYLVALAEIILPILLLIGFATRLVGLAMLLMTGVIQLVFPDGWVNFHLYWAAIAVAIMALGPGKASLDYLISSIYSRSLSKGGTA
ncbi:MAG: DoxX family protein [Rhizobiaceae bacterium]|nr:DoxX family protein [Rhizobiaceae bacterium]